MRSKMVSILLSVIMTMGIFQGTVQNVGLPNLGQPFQGGSSLTGGLADLPWPMFRQNVNHTGVSPYDTSSNPGKLKWSFETGDYVFSSPAINSDGTIYIGSTDNKLYAINLEGTEKWNFTTDGDVHSSPAISSEGIIYIGSKDGKVYAINLNGTEKWTFTTDSDVDSSPIIGSDGTIYVGSHDYRLYAINPDGSEKWTFMTGNKINDCSPAINSEGIIYIGSSDNKFYAINPDGTEKWNFITGGVISSSPTIGVDGTIYFGSGDGNLYALNSDGSEKWRFAIGSYIFSSPAINSDNIIYVGSNDYKLYAINPDGTEKWNFLTGFIVESSPSIGSDGSIFFGSKDNKVYAINPDGTERWNFTTKNGILSSPAIGSDGTIYIGSYDKKLYAIGRTVIPPIANLGSDQTINEGSQVQFNSSSSHDPDGTIVTYEWDFDISDGLWWETGAVSDATTPNPIHIYGDDGVYVATLKVTDDTGLNGIDVCNITVNNVAPTINPFGPFIINEGSYIMFDSNVTDPGSDDLTFKYDWGDGTSPTTIVYYNDGIGPEPIYDPGINEIKSPGGNHPFCVSDTMTHVYSDDGVYLLTLTVEDDDGNSSLYNTTVVVNNVAPIVTLVMTLSAEEGSQLTFEANASDPGSDDLTFNWNFEYGPTIESIHYNNGVSPEPIYNPATNDIKSPGGTFPFNASDTVTHTYGDNYNYTLNLTVTDDDGGVSVYETIVSIDNIAPSITMFMIPYPAYEGTPATYGATAQDQGSDDLSFEWDFGDSTPIIENTYYNNNNSPDPYPSPAGMYSFTASDILNHTYGDDYNYTLRLKVTDDDGGMTIFTTTVYVNNVAPTIEPFGPFTIDESSPLNLTAIAEDVGSDDLTFKWKFELGPTIEYVYYNDGIDPDPYPSPNGTIPFSMTDNVTHTYGDNYDYNLTLTVTDDDGGVTLYTTTIAVLNVAPSITPFGPFTIDEGSPLNVTANAEDVGSDDLTFEWEFECGPMITNTYYNDGTNPDPYPSPWGTYPFNSSDIVTHTYGDNYNYTLTLTVTDDDGGSSTYSTKIIVNNVAPTIESIEAYTYANFTLRIAGEKWHDVRMYLCEKEEEIGYAGIVRYPGNPDDQTVTISDIKFDLTKNYSATVFYTPEDDPVNGQPNGATPCWIILTFQDGSEERIHHTFNVRHPRTWEWNVNLNKALIGHNITFKANATDPGSDELTFIWDWGDGTPSTVTTYFNDGIAPDPYPSPWGIYPFSASDEKKHIFLLEGSYSVILTLSDDDGGIRTTLLIVMLD